MIDMGDNAVLLSIGSAAGPYLACNISLGWSDLRMVSIGIRAKKKLQCCLGHPERFDLTKLQSPLNRGQPLRGLTKKGCRLFLIIFSLRTLLMHRSEITCLMSVQIDSQRLSRRCIAIMHMTPAMLPGFTLCTACPKILRPVVPQHLNLASYPQFRTMPQRPHLRLPFLLCPLQP